MKPILQFGDDHTFKIVQFTDIHWMNGEPEDQLSRQCMDTVLDLEQPDLVVFTGDLIYSGKLMPAQEGARIRCRLSRMSWLR